MKKIVALSVALIALGLVLIIYFMKKPSPKPQAAFNFKYNVTLLNGENFICQTKKFYKAGATAGAVILENCSNRGSYFLDNYLLDNSCFEDCPSEEILQLECFRKCAAASYPDPHNIKLSITEINL